MRSDGMRYELNNPDYDLSPYTGMTRVHWLEVAHMLMEGIFSHVSGEDQPLVFPKQESEISYPKEGDPVWRFRAERFEGIARSLLIAGPLIADKPEVTVNGFELRSFYRRQILLAIDPESQCYVGDIQDAIYESGNKGPFQQIVECAALAMTLKETRKHIWDTYSQDEKDCIAVFLSGFGHAQTNVHNWRYFNVLILTFLKLEGYPIDELKLKGHMNALLTMYAGDGWYRDGLLFDYYTPWAFHVYGPVWNSWYGYDHEPEIAALIEAHSNDFIKTFNHFFDNNGQMVMWGRSNIYRTAVSSPFSANLLLEKSLVSPGQARRIMSGNLLQFVTKESTFVDGMLSLGYHGLFKSVIQAYSCSASPMWFGKVFACLYYPEAHPFWREKEQTVWERHEGIQLTELKGPGINVINRKRSGSTEIIPSKISMTKGDPRLQAYSRLAFSSDFPWEAMNPSGINTMQYTLKYGDEWLGIPNKILYCGSVDGVIYRRAIFEVTGNYGFDPSMDLAEIPLEKGVLRIDRVRIDQKDFALILGHYGLPVGAEGYEVIRMNTTDCSGAVVKSEHGSVAMMTIAGWDEVAYEERYGRNPVCDKSVVVYSKMNRTERYVGTQLLLTVLLNSPGQEEFLEEELIPVENMSFAGGERGTNCLNVRLLMKDGREFMVDFNGIEGRVTM